MGSDFRLKSDPSFTAGTTFSPYSPFTSLRKNVNQLQTQSSLINNLNAIATTLGRKYFVRTKIENRTVNLLVDTGSEVNVIPKHCLSVTAMKKLKPTNLDLKSYTGNRIEVLGCLQMDVQIGQICLKNVDFYIVENNFKPILGTPALKNNDIALCFSQNKMIQNGIKHADLFFDEKTAVKDHNLNLVTTEKTTKTNVLQLEATQPTVIAANTEKFIECTTRYPVVVAGDYSVEVESAAASYDVLFGKSVSSFSANHNKCIIRVCNASDKSIKIPAGVRLVNTVQVTVPDVAFKQPLFTESRISKLLSEIKINSKNPEIYAKAVDLIKNYHDVFASEQDELNETTSAHYDVDTGNAPPQAQQRYRTPFFLREEMKKIITKNVKTGLMSPTSSPWAAPVLLVKKSNGSYRLVCDYRKLNTVTVADSYPLPEINDLVTELAESKIFSISDLFTGFHQIPCTEQAKQKLAITTELGQFTWNRMPMGAKNCPAVFQRLMDKVFRKIPRSNLIIYLDDLLIHAANEAKNLAALEESFKVLRKHNLKLRADKTVLLSNKVKFCGFEIENGRKMPSKEKIEAIMNLKTPKNKGEAQSVFGLLNYHRTFISDFASKATEITKSYRGSFFWSSDAEKSLQNLKIEVGQAALQLEIPNMQKAHFVLETDASQNGYGAVLFVCNRNGLHAHHGPQCLRPVEYASGIFSPAQLKYQTMEKELFCGKIALHKWNHYLLGRKFTWRTDNACLTWASRIRSKNLKIATWLATIGQFDFTIELRPSKSMKISDCLSRQFVELNALKVTKRNLAELQAADPILSLIKNYVASNRWPNHPDPEIMPYLRKRQNLFFGSDGELLINHNNRIRTIPAEIMKTDIIQTYHDKNGHPGEQQCAKQLARSYFWPGLATDVKSYVQTCHRCQITKPNLHPKQAPQGLSETPNDAWEFIAFDLIGPLTLTENGHRFALVGLDVFSKKIYATALTSKHSSLITREIKRIILSFPNMPKTILTDNGGEFAQISLLCDQLGIKHNQSAPYHPQTNGAVERANQTLKSRIYASDNAETWDDQLDEIIHSINCSENVVTGYSPFQVETGVAGKNIHDNIQHEIQQRENVVEIREKARTKILQEKRVRFAQHNKPNFAPYEVDDLVLMKNRVSKHPRFLGPLKIVSVRGEGFSYELEDIDTQITFIRHCAQLKKYKNRAPENVHVNTSNEQPDDPPSSEDAAQEEPFVLPMFAFATSSTNDWYPSTPLSTDEPSELASIPSPVVSSTEASSDSLSSPAALPPSPVGQEASQTVPATRPESPDSSVEPLSTSVSTSPAGKTSTPNSSPSTSNADTPAPSPSINTPPSSPPSEASPPASPTASFVSAASAAPTEPTSPASAVVSISDPNEENSLDETFYGSLGSSGASTVSAASNTSRILAFTIDQLSIKELQDLARTYDLVRAGPKKELNPCEHNTYI
jgi:hypothetical protein